MFHCKSKLLQVFPYTLMLPLSQGNLLIDTQLWFEKLILYFVAFKSLFKFVSQIKFYFILFYINYIIHCKIKKGNHQVPKIIRVPRNKINPKKITLKIYK